MTIADTGTVPVVDQALGLELARRHANLTQRELAAEMGVSSRTVVGYERGERAAKRPTLLAWAAVTGVSLEWLEGLPVHPLGLEPRTHWFRGSGRSEQRSDWGLAA